MATPLGKAVGKLAAGLACLALAIVYCLDHGIFIGSKSVISDDVLFKTCEHLFVTGVSTSPALGGVAGFKGAQLAKDRDGLYCRFFRD